jgi:anti-anti-sigma regulatory factor
LGRRHLPVSALRMAASKNQVWVSCSGRLGLFRLIGRATASESTGFKAATEALTGRGCFRFAIDLSECESMDSTFIGVLTGLSRHVHAGGRDGGVDLVNLRPQVRLQLDNLYVLDLFQLLEYAPGPDAAFQPVGGAPVAKIDLCRLMLEAHRTLMDASAANVPKFKQVTEFLEQDLRRLDPNTPPPAAST